jgi:magnesium chelatase family protein
VRERVMAASQRQHVRQNKSNAELSPTEVDTHCELDAHGETLLQQATARLGLSARAQHRIVRVARTVADLAASERISVSHVEWTCKPPSTSRLDIVLSKTYISS